MVLGIFLTSGDSFEGMAKVGQDIKYKKFYLSYFAKNFSKIYIFSYGNEIVRDLPTNVEVIPNKYNLHRFIYGFLMPFLNQKYIIECDGFRAYHLLGTLPAIITKVFFNKPFAFNYGYDYKEFAWVEKKYLQYILLTLIHPIANYFAFRIFAITKMVLNWTPKEKTIYFPNGVDIKVFKPSKKRKNKKLVILNIGRLETQKNQVNLVRAIGGLKAKLLIVGRGSLKEELLRVAKQEKVDLQIIDKVDNDKLPKVYNEADIFALPSITEGPVKVLLEAMACGMPVVGSNVNGIREIIIDNKNAVLCGTDVKSINTSLTRVMGDKELFKKISKNAREYILKYHDLDKLLLKEVKELQRVCRA